MAVAHVGVTVGNPRLSLIILYTSEITERLLLGSFLTPRTDTGKELGCQGSAS